MTMNDYITMSTPILKAKLVLSKTSDEDKAAIRDILAEREGKKDELLNDLLEAEKTLTESIRQPRDYPVITPRPLTVEQMDAAVIEHLETVPPPKEIKNMAKEAVNRTEDAPIKQTPPKSAPVSTKSKSAPKLFEMPKLPTVAEIRAKKQMEIEQRKEARERFKLKGKEVEYLAGRKDETNAWRKGKLVEFRIDTRYPKYSVTIQRGDGSRIQKSLEYIKALNSEDKKILDLWLAKQQGLKDIKRVYELKKELEALKEKIRHFDEKIQRAEENARDFKATVLHQEILDEYHITDIAKELLKIK